MPHKFNAARRHKFPKKRYRVTNWAEYTESLRRRGDLTIWVTDDTLKQWRAPRRTTPGGQPKYSNIAIETCLTLRTIYKLPLRQTQGLMRSIARLMGVDIPVPDFSTLSRRGLGLRLPAKPRVDRTEPIHLTMDSTGLKIFGEGEWLQVKHETKAKRKSWRKLHLGLDLTTGEIICSDLTLDHVGDSTALPGLLDQFDGPVSRFLADGAYDGTPTRNLLTARFGDAVEVIIPPPKNAVLALKSRDDPSLRDQHIAQIQTYGRLAWQVRSGYNQRSRAEAQIGRWKSVIGPKLRSRRFENQKTEAQIGVRALKQPSHLLKKLAARPRQHDLALALREIGRVERTLFIIEWLLNTEMQRRAQIGLNKGEAHHALKGALRIGRQGEIRDRTTEGQHFRIAGLNLLTAIIIYWNTKQLGMAVAQRRKAGLDCSPELLAHISPLGWAHILLTGEYRWRNARA